MEEEEQSRERERKVWLSGRRDVGRATAKQMALSLSVAVLQAMRTRGRSAAVPEWI